MPVTFVKSVHQHVTQIWDNVNIGDRDSQFAMYSVTGKCFVSKDKHHPAKSDLKSSVTSTAFSSPCRGRLRTREGQVCSRAPAWGVHVSTMRYSQAGSKLLDKDNQVLRGASSCCRLAFSIGKATASLKQLGSANPSTKLNTVTGSRKDRSRGYPHTHTLSTERELC